jgi:hypothetical protein
VYAIDFLKSEANTEAKNNGVPEPWLDANVRGRFFFFSSFGLIMNLSSQEGSM